jgi:hypothetical protein
MPALSVAVIGTAGRDKTKPMTIDLWCAMWHDACARFPADKDFTLVSGGAAWADHIAVSLYNSDKVGFLRLHLPAPLVKRGKVWQYEGGSGTSGSAANYYHKLYKEATGSDGLREIAHAIEKGCNITYQPVSDGYGAMFARNNLVAAEAQAGLAYTFGTGKEPADGGTKYTWDRIEGRRVHVDLNKLLEKTW